MSEPLTSETFEKHVGSEFRLAGQEATIKLVAVERLGEAPEGHRAPFSLQFEGDAGQLIPQRTYGLTHAELGALDIFIVPLGPKPGAMRYEAVFG